MTPLLLLVAVLAPASAAVYKREAIEDPLCECVPYYQCDEDRRIKVHGDGIIDQRMPTCPDIEICCMPPEPEHGGQAPVKPPPVTPPTEEPPVQRCECVKFFLCDENRQHITDGATLLDERFACGEDDEVCCYPPEPVTEPPVHPPVEPPVHPPVGPPVDPGHEGPLPTPPPEIPCTDDCYTSVPRPHRPPTNGLCGYKGISEPVDFGNAFRITGVDGLPEPTAFGEFPWMVAVMKDDGHDGLIICGGSLITPKVVLTAAHCIKKAGNSAIKLRAGEWDIHSEKEPLRHQDRAVARIIAHPEFNAANLHNDIALIVVDHPFDLTDCVDTICAPAGQPHVDLSRCIATGWGKTGFGPNGTLPGILKKVSLPIVPNDECQLRLRHSRLGKYFRLHKSFICAGGIPEQDTCTGDGGGPLVCPISEDGRYAQVGIVAWGIGCGNDYPAVYASVAYFNDWIEEHLKDV